MSVLKELNNLGDKIVKDAKKNALKNKKTGKLDSSLQYNTTYISEDKFILNIEEVYYGKFLNDKNGFMDKAISDNINKGIDSIVEALINDIKI